MAIFNLFTFTNKNDIMVFRPCVKARLYLYIALFIQPLQDGKFINEATDESINCVDGDTSCVAFGRSCLRQEAC